MKKARSMSSFDFDASRDQVGASTPSAGEMLKAARERSGLHIAALAVMLKVPVKKLEALETSRFDLLPDIVFARALASSVCRTLKIDAEAVLARLPHSGAPQFALRSSALGASFRSPGDGPGLSMWSGFPKPAVVAVLVLLVASLVIAFLPTLTKQFKQVSALIDSRLARSTSAGASESLTAAFELKSERSLTGEAASEPGASTAAATPTTTQLRDASNLAPGAQEPTTPAGAAASVAGIVVFRASGESWVEVADAKRQIILRRTLTKGESVGVSGVLPLSATVGRADMTEVDIRGQAFNLVPWSKDNVARFEVK